MKILNIYSNPPIFIALFVIIPSLFLFYFNWTNTQNKSTYKLIDGDGLDYYSYLSSTFITKDLGNLNPNNSFVVETNNGNINLHPVGVAILELPFFGLGYVFSKLLKEELTGYNHAFQFAIGLAALVYLTIGLWFIYKTLRIRGCSTLINLFTLLSLFFGTTLIHYTINEPSMSHVYSFSLISAFLFYNQLLANEYSKKIIFSLAFILGLIILVRPINILILLFVPFFYKSFLDFKIRIKEIFYSKKTVLTSIFIITLILGIQLAVWYIQTNHFLQYSYRGNGFYFFRPQLLNMLFGFNSGIFVYTPLFTIAVFSLLVLLKINLYKAIVALFFAGISLYIYSSYWGWTYFDGIGTRVFVDFLSIIAIGFAGVFSHLKSFILKLSLIGFALICIVYNMIVCYQYKQGIIQASGMNFEKYKYVFLKTDLSFKNCLGGSYDLQPYSEEKKEPILFTENKFDNYNNHYYLFNRNEYGIEFKTKELPVNTKKLHITININRFDFSVNHSKEALIAVALNDKENNCKSFQAFKLNDTPPKNNTANWKNYAFNVNLTTKITEGDELSVFVWNKNKEIFAIDNFEVKVYDYGNIN